MDDLPQDVVQMLDDRVQPGLSDQLHDALTHRAGANGRFYVCQLSEEEARFLEERVDGLRVYARELYGKRIDLTPARVLRLLVQKWMDSAGWR